MSSPPLDRIQMVFSDTEHEESADDVSPTSAKPNEDSDDHQEAQYWNMAQGELLVEKAIKSGYLKKKGAHRRNWKKRWVVLFPTRLCYYHDEKEYEILNLVMLDKIHSCAYVETKKRPFVFALITKERTWYYQAESHAEMESWIQTIRNQLKVVENIAGQHPHEIHLQQPPTLYPSASRSVSSPSQIQTSSARASESLLTPSESLLTPSEYPSLPNTPFSSQPSSYATNRLRNMSLPSDTRASPLTQTWVRNEESDSDDEPPLSAVLQKIPGDDIVHCQGYLYKLKTIGGIKTWKKQWFVLRNGKLISYKDETEYEVRRMVPLCSVLDILDTESNKKYVFKVVLAKKPWILCADSEQERLNWVVKLREIHSQVRTIKE